MMMDILLCGLSASLSSVIGKKLHVIFLLFHNEGRHSFFQWVTSNFPPWLMSLCLCSLLSQFQLRRTPTCSSDSIKSSEKLFVSCFAYTVRGFLPVRHFWAACDCDIKHVYVTLQAHVSQIVQTSMALTEKPPGSRLLNNTTLIYSAGVGESCSAHAKIGKSESSFRFLLSIIYSYSHSPGKSLASVPGSRVVRRRKQCLECEEREKKLESFPHVNLWLSSSSSSSFSQNVLPSLSPRVPKYSGWSVQVNQCSCRSRYCSRAAFLSR